VLLGATLNKFDVSYYSVIIEKVMADRGSVTLGKCAGVRFEYSRESSALRGAQRTAPCSSADCGGGP
jgi:hypothetical protein